MHPDNIQPIMPCTTIPAARIDLEDDTFSLRPDIDECNHARLRRSISRVGVLTLPILRPTAGDRYQIISGARQLGVAVRDLRQEHIDCRLLAAATPDPEAMAVALEAILATRRPTLVEQVLFFKKILQWLSREAAAARFLPLLDLKVDSRSVDRLLRLAELEAPILAALHLGDLQEATAHDLAALPTADRLALFEVSHALHLSTSNQKKLVAAGRELAARQTCSVAAILAAPEIKEIMAHPQANIPQKSAKLMDLLAARLSPRLAAAEKDFNRFTAGLNLPKNVRLSHAMSFERDSITLAVEFKNRRQLEKIWPSLADILDNRD